jgi:nitrite reductase (NADH) small subunit
MTKWIRIAPAESIPPREGRSVRIGSASIALFNTGSGFLAVENRCPHSGGPLADGILAGNTVACPMHNWRICLESGRVTKPCDVSAPPVRTFDARVEDGIVLIALEQAQAAA